MDKRYQVFVSSTYADLHQERQKVIQALMEMDCIAAGMELFPAADEEQWEFIKRVINDCDYYILIIGGRYGSLTPEGISYTEQEYDYAMSIGLKVLAFLHQSPDEIPVGKSDMDPALRKKLDAFRSRVSENRLVKFWRTTADLPGLVALSLSKTIKLYPAVGWVRANNVANDELLADLNTLRKENEHLRKTVSELQPNAAPQEQLDLAPLDEPYQVTLEYIVAVGYRALTKTEIVTATWAEMFACMAPDLVEHPVDARVNQRLATWLFGKCNPGREIRAEVKHDDWQTIRTQLCALGLVTTTYTKTTGGGMGLFWRLTERGEKLMVQLRAVRARAKKSKQSPAASG